jgi:hypothetical protein
MTRGSSIAENYVNPPAEASKIKKIEPYKLALMGVGGGVGWLLVYADWSALPSVFMVRC